MLKRLAQQFMNSGGGAPRGGGRGRAPRGRSAGRGGGSTGARIGSMVERFVRKRR